MMINSHINVLVQIKQNFLPHDKFESLATRKTDEKKSLIANQQARNDFIEKLKVCIKQTSEIYRKLAFMNVFYILAKRKY